MSAVKLNVLQPETDRKRFLGGSDVAAVIGMGATYDGVTQTAYTVWQKKVGEIASDMDPERKLWLNRRKRWEGPIVEMLREEFSAEIVAVNQRYVDPEYDFLAAEIDFEAREPDGSIANGEIKTVHPLAYGERHGWGDPGTSDIPVHYAAQVMHGLMVTGRSRCVVAVMLGIDNMVFYFVERDEETIAGMRAASVKFWQEHVLRKVPPPPQTPHDMRAYMLRFSGRPVDLDAMNMTRLQRLDAVRGSIATLSEEEEEISFALGDYVCEQWASPNPYFPPAEAKKQGKKQKAEDAMAQALLFYHGRRVGSWNKQGGSSLDQKRLRVEKPGIVEQFTRTYTFRVLRVKLV
jgi:predicted phage-related endonuclease